MVGFLVGRYLALSKRQLKPPPFQKSPTVEVAPIHAGPTSSSVDNTSNRETHEWRAKAVSPLLVVGLLLWASGLVVLPRAVLPDMRLDGSVLVFAPFATALSGSVRTTLEVTPFDDRPWATHLQVVVRSLDDKPFPFMVIASGIYQFQPDCTPIATSLFSLLGGSKKVLGPDLLQCTSPGGTAVGAGPSVPDWTYRISTVKQQDMMEKVHVGPIGLRGSSEGDLQSDLGSKALVSFREHIAVGSSTAAWAMGQDYHLHSDATVPDTYTATFDYYGQSLNHGFISSRVGRTSAGPVGRPDGANVTGYPAKRTALPMDSSTDHVSMPTEAGGTEPLIRTSTAAWVALRSESTSVNLGPIALPEYIRSASPASASSAELAWATTGPLDRGISWEVGSRSKEGHDQWLTFIAGVLTALGGSAWLAALQVYAMWRADTSSLRRTERRRHHPSRSSRKRVNSGRL